MNKQPKPLTLTLNKEFRHAYYQGKSCATPYFILYLVRGRTGMRRYGITTSKKLGGAVQRNRARRLLRTAVWALADELPPGKDLVFVARERILSAKSPEVAAALLHSPKVLFLDEPTIGLDAVSKLKVREFIREENCTRGTTVILTTHDMQDVEALCSRVLLIGKGQLLLDGTTEAIRAMAGENLSTEESVADLYRRFGI